LLIKTFFHEVFFHSIGDYDRRNAAALFRGHLTPSKYARKDDFAVTSTPTLERGRVFASDDAAATVTAARTVADGGIYGPPPRPVSPHAASSMLEKWNRNKNGTKDIGIQAFDAILQLGVGYRLIA
jgi:hypothetical protein